MSGLNNPLTKALINISSHGLGRGWKHSLALIRYVTLVAVSTITHAKNQFRRENFGEANFSTLILKVLKDECEDLKAQLFSTALRKAFDAVEKKYLHQLALGFYGKDGDREYIMEYYVFEFRYNGESSTFNNQSSTGAAVAVLTVQRIQDQMIDMLKNLVAISHRGERPTNIGIKLWYNDDTPDTYHVPGFRRYAQDNGWAERASTLTTVEAGSIETYHHKLIARFYKRQSEEVDVGRSSDLVAIPSTVNNISAPLATGTTDAGRSSDKVVIPSTVNGVSAPLASGSKQIVSRSSDTTATTSTVVRGNNVSAPRVTGTTKVSRSSDNVAPSTVARAHGVSAPLATGTTNVSKSSQTVASSTVVRAHEVSATIVYRKFTFRYFHRYLIKQKVSKSSQTVIKSSQTVAPSTVVRANGVSATRATGTTNVSRSSDTVATPSTVARAHGVSAPLATGTTKVSRSSDKVAPSTVARAHGVSEPRVTSATVSEQLPGSGLTLEKSSCCREPLRINEPENFIPEANLRHVEPPVSPILQSARTEGSRAQKRKVVNSEAKLRCVDSSVSPPAKSARTEGSRAQKRNIENISAKSSEAEDVDSSVSAPAKSARTEGMRALVLATPQSPPAKIRKVSRSSDSVATPSTVASAHGVSAAPATDTAVSEQLPGSGLTLEKPSCSNKPLKIDEPEKEIIPEAEDVDSSVSAPAKSARTEGMRALVLATPQSPPAKIRKVSRSSDTVATPSTVASAHGVSAPLATATAVSEQLPGSGLTLENPSCSNKPLKIDEPEKEIIPVANLRHVESSVSPPAQIATTEDSRALKRSIENISAESSEAEDVDSSVSAPAKSARTEGMRALVLATPQSPPAKIRKVSRSSDSVATPSTVASAHGVSAPLATDTAVSEQRPGSGVALENPSCSNKPLKIDEPEKEIIPEAEDVDSSVSAPAKSARTEGMRALVLATPQSPPAKIRKVSRSSDTEATPSTVARAHGVSAPLATGTTNVSRPSDTVAPPTLRSEVSEPVDTGTTKVSRSSDSVATPSTVASAHGVSAPPATDTAVISSTIVLLSDTDSEDESFTQEPSERSSSPGSQLRCPCFMPEEVDDPDTTTHLICNYCGKIQHAVCFGLMVHDVTTEVMKAHACDICAESIGLHATDPTFNTLTIKQRRSLATYRRVLEWLFNQKSVSANKISERFRVPTKIAMKLMDMFRYYNILRFRKTDTCSSVKRIKRPSLNECAKVFFKSVQDSDHDESTISDLPRVLLQNINSRARVSNASNNSEARDVPVPSTVRNDNAIVERPVNVANPAAMNDTQTSKQKNEAEEPPRKFFKTRRLRAPSRKYCG